MWEIISLIILVLDIAVVVDIVGAQGELLRKLIWIGLVLLMPIIGLVLYFTMGRKTVGA